MINGAHSIIYSKKPEADRAFLRDVLGLPNVDVGEGWLIFGLPPAEVAVHPSEKNNVHEFYLMCEDVNAFVAAMKQHKVACSEVFNRGWGLLGQGRLPLRKMANCHLSMKTSADPLGSAHVGGGELGGEGEDDYG